MGHFNRLIKMAAAVDENKKVRVLLVESVDDDITRRRHNILLSNDKLKEYEFEYCYVKTFNAEDQSAIEFGICPDFSLSEDDLFAAVNAKASVLRARFYPCTHWLCISAFPISLHAGFRKTANGSPRLSIWHTAAGRSCNR